MSQHGLMYFWLSVKQLSDESFGLSVSPNDRIDYQVVEAVEALVNTEISILNKQTSIDYL